MKKSGVIIGIVVLVVIAGAAVMLIGNKKTYNGSSTSSNTTATTAAATITYSSSGFSPATTTVKSGDTVAIKNDTKEDMQLDSDPHPVHTDDTDLNVGLVTPGQTKTFMVMKKGSFGYHNHLDPGDTGKIVIE